MRITRFVSLDGLVWREMRGRCADPLEAFTLCNSWLGRQREGGYLNAAFEIYRGDRRIYPPERKPMSSVAPVANQRQA